MKQENTPENNDEQVTLLSMTKRLYSLYRPHFGFDAKNRKRSLWLIGIVIGNVLLAFALAFVNVSMASLMGLISVPGVTYTGFFAAAAQCVVAFLSYGLLTGLDAMMASFLGNSLTSAINKKLQKKWFKNQTFYGTKMMSKNAPNPSQLLSHDNNEMNRAVTELFDNFLTTISNFVVGIIGLYTLSAPLELTIMSMSIVIPGYLVACTAIYAIVYNSMTSKIGDSLEDLQTDQRKMEGSVQTKVHHVITHAEEIAFKKGAEYEHHSLMDTLNQTKIIQKSAAKVRSLLTFLTNLHAEFTSFFALMLCAPNIISNKLSFASILEIPYHFQNVVNAFTWKSDNFDKVTECAVTLKRLEEFNDSMARWKALQKESSKLRFTPGNGRDIVIKNLTICKPDGTPILRDFSINIPKGNVSLLQGQSGAGKTSLLRALAGLSPIASGEIQGLTGNMQFVPSLPYFPVDRSLIDAIIYPRISKATQHEIKKAKSLMHQFGFKPETIKDLEMVKDWNSQLSDGEKQRIEIIGIIMKNPDIFIFDEATSGIDHVNKAKIERALKDLTPSRTFIQTDHNPSKGNFIDNIINISTSQSEPRKRKRNTY